AAAGRPAARGRTVPGEKSRTAVPVRERPRVCARNHAWLFRWLERSLVPGGEVASRDVRAVDSVGTGRWTGYRSGGRRHRRPQPAAAAGPGGCHLRNSAGEKYGDRVRRVVSGRRSTPASCQRSRRTATVVDTAARLADGATAGRHRRRRSAVLVAGW